MDPKSAPDAAGWWWCIPDTACEWYSRHPAGLVCKVSEYGEDCDAEPDELYVQATFAADAFGFTGEYSGDVYGRWYGPIPAPE